MPMENSTDNFTIITQTVVVDYNLVRLAKEKPFWGYFLNTFFDFAYKKYLIKICRLEPLSGSNLSVNFLFLLFMELF